MERITRALELALASREAAVRQPATTDTVTDIGRKSARPTGDDTVTTAAILTPDAAVLARERVLPPGAGGPAGAPYKLLRTQVLKRMDQLGANTLAILSAAKADGKTLTAINLAIAIAAEHGRTALLVDFDLRNPNVHQRFGFTPAVGVDDCLQTGAPLKTAMVKVAGYERLTILPARNLVEHSSELLASQRTVELVSELRARYSNRIMIFDLPPVMLADDALAFSKIVQAGLVVIAEGQTQRDEVSRVIDMLRDLPIVGTVLNGSRARVLRYY